MPRPPATPTAVPDPQPTPAPSAKSGPEAQPKAAPATAALGELVRCSIYVDEGADQFLEQIRGAGRTARPKVDASRSAVVRLALGRLASEMTPEQVITELRRRAGKVSSTGGRKRV